MLVQSHLSGRFVFLCLIPALSMLCMQPVNMQWTILFRDRGVPLPLIGGISGAIGLVIAGGGWVSKRFLGERHMGAVVITICAGVVGTVLMPGLWGIAPFMVHEVGRGAFGPLLHSLLVRETPERYRATLLSVRSTVMSIGAIIGLILSGYAAQQVGITVTWIGAGGLFLCGSIVLLVLLRRKSRAVY